MKTVPFRLSKYVPKYIQRRVRHSVIYLILFVAFLAFAVGVYKGGVQLIQLKAEQITLKELPYALCLSLLRMTTSYFASLFFAFALGLLAARTKTGEKIIIPLLDILQSVPVIGFFPAAITFFIGITQGHRLGVEMAAIFLIFTSQAWNMAFAVYEAIKTIPQDNLDTIDSFGVSGSQRFWKLYAPASTPRLIYNSILSWSNGWYFLVACEIIAVGPIHYHLPGIGSFLARAAEQDRIPLVLWGLLSLTTLILSLDALIWRPLSIWSERFRQDFSGGGSTPHTPHPSLVRMQRIQTELRPFRRSMIRMLRVLLSPLFWFLREILLPLVWDLPTAIAKGIWQESYSRFGKPTLKRWNQLAEKSQWIPVSILWILGAGLGIFAGTFLFRWLSPPWPLLVREIPTALAASTGRLIVALGISLLWTLPLVLISWNRPRLRQILTTIAQVGASLPAIALFPLLILIAVRHFGGGMEISSILLLLTGMQWYLLFNGLGGAAIIPHEMAEATRALGLSRVQTWRRLVLPAIRPALVTGAITAWGGGWNALVVSEYVAYKDQILMVHGIGALLNQAVYQLGDNRAITLCIAAMVGWILIINSLVWRPLYQTAAERYKFDT